MTQLAKWPDGAGLVKHAGLVFGTKPATVEPASVAKVGLSIKYKYEALPPPKYHHLFTI